MYCIILEGAFNSTVLESAKLSSFPFFPPSQYYATPRCGWGPRVLEVERSSHTFLKWWYRSKTCPFKQLNTHSLEVTARPIRDETTGVKRLRDTWRQITRSEVGWCAQNNWNGSSSVKTVQLIVEKHLVSKKKGNWQCDSSKSCSFRHMLNYHSNIIIINRQLSNGLEHLATEKQHINNGESRFKFSYSLIMKCLFPKAQHL